MYQVNTKTETMDCKKCGNEIPLKRLEIIPGTKTCVNCSTESPKRGVPVMRGTGDHTWVDLDIMTQEQYNQYEELNKKSSKLDNTPD
jgi:RNA polymerase-binding transcription factor DksA